MWVIVLIMVCFEICAWRELGKSRRNIWQGPCAQDGCCWDSTLAFLETGHCSQILWFIPFCHIFHRRQRRSESAKEMNETALTQASRELMELFVLLDSGLSVLWGGRNRLWNDISEYHWAWITFVFEKSLTDFCKIKISSPQKDREEWKR